MADLSNILTKGIESDLANTAIEDGKLRYTTDTGRVYLDIVDGDSSSRITISDIIQGYTEEEIRAILAPLPKFYRASDTYHLFIYSNDVGWYDISKLYLSEDTSTANNLNIWFSTIDGEKPDQPLYSPNITFNPATSTVRSTNMSLSGKIKVGEMVITTSVDENDDRIIDFFVGSDSDFGDVDEAEVIDETSGNIDYNYGDLDEET